jgi:hypothetical protein
MKCDAISLGLIEVSSVFINYRLLRRLDETRTRVRGYFFSRYCISILVNKSRIEPLPSGHKMGVPTSCYASNLVIHLPVHLFIHSWLWPIHLRKSHCPYFQQVLSRLSDFMFPLEISDSSCSCLKGQLRNQLHCSHSQTLVKEGK